MSLNKLNVEADKPGLTAVVPTLDFDCIVDGETLKASITHIEDNPMQQVYHIRFSDGYKSVFHSDERRPNWFDQNRNQKYARAIINDLNALGFFGVDREVHCFNLPVEGSVTNVWVIEDEKDNYSVHHGNDFRFYIRRTGKGWEYTTAERHKGRVNVKLVNLVTAEMDALK